MELQQSTYLEYKERMPSPGILALVYFLVFAAGMTFLLISSSGASYPTPYDPVEKAQHFYSDFASGLRAQSFFLFWSALPLGIYTAFMTARLRGLNLHRGGVNIAQFGGFGAAIFIGLSGLVTWVLSQPGITNDPGTTRIMQLLAFATGGTGAVVLSGLLIAGICVTAGIDRIIPRWVMWLGLVIALISVLSMINLVAPDVSILLPIGRFLGIIWMIIAGFTVKRKKLIGKQQGA
jgi:hypothetical protein